MVSCMRSSGHFIFGESPEGKGRRRWTMMCGIIYGMGRLMEIRPLLPAVAVMLGAEWSADAGSSASA